MKTIKFLTIATTAIIFMGGLLTIRTSAADNAATTTPLRGQIFRHIAGRLNLTDEQKAQVQSALGGEKETLRALLGQLHDARKNLRAAIQSGDANETAVRSASARVAALEGDLAVERMKIFGKISPVLTDEQRRQISEFEQRLDDAADSLIARAGERLGG